MGRLTTISMAEDGLAAGRPDFGSVKLGKMTASNGFDCWGEMIMMVSWSR